MPWIFASLAVISCQLVNPVHAADLAQPVLVAPAAFPPAQKPFFVRLGANWSFFNPGLAVDVASAHVPGSGGSISPVVAAVVEGGVFLTSHVAVSFTAGYPPIVTLKGTGSLAPQGALLKVQSGLATLTAHYHFDNFGPVRPYIGTGIGYAVTFRDIATPLGVINPQLSNNAGFVLQAGADYALTDSFGLFADFKKTWLKQNLNGLTVVPGVPALLLVEARIRSDPIQLTSGISYRF